MLIQPVLRPVLQPVLRSIFDPGIGGGGTPSLDDQVKALFVNGEQGVWYDESDLSSMFQSGVSGGGLLIPVTAADQPVGARMDKHIDVGWVVVGDAVWAKTQGDGVLSVVGNVVTVTGATTVTHINRIAGSIPAVPGSVRMSVVANYAGATGVQFWLRGAPRSLTNNVPVTVVNGLTNSSLERLDVSSGTVSFTINELSYWRGNHWTALNNSARPILRLTGGLYSLEWDGVDDCGSTPSFNMGPSQQAYAFAGVLINTGSPVFLFETSAVANSNPGAINAYFNDPGVGGLTARQNYGPSPTGPASQTISVPNTSVYTIDYDLSRAVGGQAIFMRRNGAAYANGGSNSTTTQQLGNYPLYIGARNNSGNFLKGHTYGEIVVGKLATSPEIASTEAYLAAKTGVTLP